MVALAAAVYCLCLRPNNGSSTRNTEPQCVYSMWSLWRGCVLWVRFNAVTILYIYRSRTLKGYDCNCNIWLSWADQIYFDSIQSFILLYWTLVHSGMHKGCTAMIAAKKLLPDSEQFILSWLHAGRRITSRDTGSTQHKGMWLDERQSFIWFV